MEIITTPLTDTMKRVGITDMGVPEDTLFANEDVSLPPSAKPLTIGDGDTILTIAASTGKDWQEIAKINGLEYPYISKNYMDGLSDIKGVARAPVIPKDSLTVVINGLVPDAGDYLAFGEGKIALEIQKYKDGTIYLVEPAPTGLPTTGVVTLHAKKYKVAFPGDTILIPADNAPSSSVAASEGDVERALYGEDEFLDVDGYHHEDTGDVYTISGIQNLAMQLWHRINTLKGELTELGHPEYGSLVPTFIGMPMTPVWQERILLECKLVAEADPRVQQVSNVKFYNEGTAIFFEADVFPISDIDPFHVTMPIG